MSDSGNKAATAAPPRPSTAVIGELVSVKVGPEKKTYRIHKALLVHHSDYFRNALRGSWTEAKNRVVTLDDVEPCIFDIFVDWLYTGEMPTNLHSWLEAIGVSTSEMNEEARLFEYSMTTIKAYILGDRLLAPGFRAEATLAFDEDGLGAGPNGSTSRFCALIHYAYRNIPANSVLLQSLVDDFCKAWEPNEDTREEARELQRLPPAFLVRVMRRQNELRIEATQQPTSKPGTAAVGRSGPVVVGKMKIRCYQEHESKEDEQVCKVSGRSIILMHMEYDEKLDCGIFK